MCAHQHMCCTTSAALHMSCDMACQCVCACLPAPYPCPPCCPQVYVISRSRSKEELARKMGAKGVIPSGEEEEMKKYAGRVRAPHAVPSGSNLCSELRASAALSGGFWDLEQHIWGQCCYQPEPCEKLPGHRNEQRGSLTWRCMHLSLRMRARPAVSVAPSERQHCLAPTNPCRRHHGRRDRHGVS